MNDGLKDGFGKPTPITVIGTKLAIIGRWLGIGTVNAQAPLHVSIQASSDNNNPTTPQPGIRLGWSEGKQNLGVGEGVKLSWSVRLFSDTSGYEVASISSYKTNATDTSRLSSLKFSVSSDGLAEPTEIVDMTATDVNVTGNLTTTGSVLAAGTGGVGYATGAGGTVTQATSKSTSVGLDKMCGRITMNAASLAAGTAVGFTFINSLIGANDLLLVGITGGPFSNNYRVAADVYTAGQASITLVNTSSGALAEGIQLTFAIHKAVIA